MEYLEGDNLEYIFARRGPLPPDEVVAYMAQAARGLAHAHAKGVIHRDIKPTNMFLVKTGTVKVLDLGFGEFVGMAGHAGNVFDTDEGIVVGTTDFMSPEQVQDKPIDARTDLFSLGCTMYLLLTGTYAFPGVTREDRLVKRMRECHVPITDVRPGLPGGLVAIVDRLLAVCADDRFSSAFEAAETLEALLAPASRPELGSSAKPGTKTPSGGASSDRGEPEPELDWFVIESALRPGGHHAREAPRPLARNDPQPRPTKGLHAHRKVLEQEGKESGRDVHKQYRDELLQMKREMAELRSTDPTDNEPSAIARWLERIGEMLGDSLAEPSMLTILLAILAVLLILVLALAFAIQ
jgi:serine/threonine protein kinase